MNKNEIIEHIANLTNINKKDCNNVFEATFKVIASYLKKNESATQDSQTGKLGITITNHFSYPIITNIEETGAAFGHLKVGDIVLSITNYKNNTTNKYSIVDENMSFSTIFDNGLDLPNKKVTVEELGLYMAGGKRNIGGKDE